AQRAPPRAEVDRVAAGTRGLAADRAIAPHERHRRRRFDREAHGLAVAGSFELHSVLVLGLPEPFSCAGKSRNLGRRSRISRLRTTGRRRCDATGEPSPERAWAVRPPIGGAAEADGRTEFPRRLAAPGARRARASQRRTRDVVVDPTAIRDARSTDARVSDTAPRALGARASDTAARPWPAAAEETLSAGARTTRTARSARRRRASARTARTSRRCVACPGAVREPGRRARRR